MFNIFTNSSITYNYYSGPRISTIIIKRLLCNIMNILYVKPVFNVVDYIYLLQFKNE